MYSIAHEIGHVILKHRNSTLVKQTKREIKKQEREADKFAKQFYF
jgi:Zn-dependent peptidase ImmA (M78 family)